MIPSRFPFYIITVSVFLLVLSSVFLFQFSISSSFLQSTFNVKGEQIRFPFISSDNSPRTSEMQSSCKGLLCTESFYGKDMIAQQRMKSCAINQAPLRVYMYDLPSEFHFGLLGWKGKNVTWPNVNDPSSIPHYPGGLNLQHSMEYWLTLDLLASEAVRSSIVIRVKDANQADVIFVPFFASLSYNRHSKLEGNEKVSLNKVLQNKLVNFLMKRDEWKRYGGKDHVIVAHHPNSMLDARKKLGSAMFVLADFGRYPAAIANLEKDIIAPYKHVVRTIPSTDSPPFEKRPVLIYFQGAIYRKDGGIVRQELYYLLKDESDVHFSFGSVQGNGIKQAGLGMSSSKFCLNIAGDTPSSNRLFDAIVSHCVPVIISDEIELPFEDVLDYSEFCVIVHASDAVKKGYLLNLLRSINRDKWTKMWEKLKEIVPHFQYQYPSQPCDAVNMIWRELSQKVSSVRFKLNRENRYRRWDERKNKKKLDQ